MKPKGTINVKLLSCPQGHYWEAVDAREGDATDHEVCPVCGAPPDTLPLLDLAPTGDRPLSASPRTAAPPLRDEAGFPVIAGYEIQEAWGRGPTGVALFLARQVLVNRVVLLKVVMAREDPGQIAWGSLRGEASALGRLSHPNIVEVHEAGERDRQLFYNAIEFVGGPTLARKIRDKAVPVRQAVRLVETLARAMQHAHDEGIVHRNLKPASIHLRRMEEQEDPAMLEHPGPSPLCCLRDRLYLPKIADFGLARRAVEGDVNDLELQAGNAGYLSPEQAWGRAREIGPATDVYALGAILYHLLAGRPPFHADSESETLDLIQCKEVAPPSRWHPKLSKDLDAICRKCLAKQPRRRYASAMDLAEDLRRWAEGMPVLARRIGGRERLSKWVRRRPALATLGLVVLLACVSTLMAFLGGSNQVEAEAQRDEALRREQQLHFQLDQVEGRLEETQQRERQTAYRQSIRRADLAVTNGNKREARAQLELCREAERGWEWHFLQQRLSSLPAMRITDFDQTLRSVAFSPDGQYLATAGGDPGTRTGGEVRVWHASTRLLAFRLIGARGPVHDLVFDSRGMSLAVGGASSGDRDGEVTVWTLGFRGGTRRFQVTFPGNPITSLAYDAEDHHLIAAAGNGILRQLDASTGNVSSPLFGTTGFGRAPMTTRVAVSTDDSWIAAAQQEANQTQVWTSSNSRIPPFLVFGNTLDASFNPVDHTLALASADHTIHIWDMSIRRETRILRGHTNRVVRIAFTRDGKRLASASADGTVKVWDTGSGEVLLTLQGFGAGARALAFSPTGRSLAIVKDREVQILGANPGDRPWPGAD